MDSSHWTVKYRDTEALFKCVLFVTWGRIDFFGGARSESKTASTDIVNNNDY